MNLEEEIMSKEANVRVYYPSYLFRNAQRFENWGTLFKKVLKVGSRATLNFQW